MLIGHWKLNGTLADSSGYNRHLTEVYSGFGDHIELDTTKGVARWGSRGGNDLYKWSSSALKWQGVMGTFTPPELSVCFFAKILFKATSSDTSYEYTTLVGTSGLQEQQSWSLNTVDLTNPGCTHTLPGISESCISSSIAAYYGTGAFPYASQPSSFIRRNLNYTAHFCFVYSMEKMQAGFYVDGMSANFRSMTSPETPSMQSSYILIGGAPDGSIASYPGTEISNVRVYSKVLNISEIRSIIQNTKIPEDVPGSRAYPPIGFTPDKNSGSYEHSGGSYGNGIYKIVVESEQVSGSAWNIFNRNPATNLRASKELVWRTRNPIDGSTNSVVFITLPTSIRCTYMLIVVDIALRIELTEFKLYGQLKESLAWELLHHQISYQYPSTGSLWLEIDAQQGYTDFAIICIAPRVASNIFWELYWLFLYGEEMVQNTCNNSYYNAASNWSNPSCMPCQAGYS